jgi:hypothetical protein
LNLGAGLWRELGIPIPRLGHNVWSGGALPVVVTLVGWVALIKGLLLLFLSPEAAAGLYLGGLHYEQPFYFTRPFYFSWAST